MRLAIFIPSYGDGGVERMLVNMARGLAAQGVEVLFLTGNPNGPHLGSLDGVVAVEHFPRQAWVVQVWRLFRLVRVRRIDCVLAGKLSDNSVAVAAKRLAGGAFKVILRPGTAVTERLSGRSGLRRWLKYSRMRRIYARADAVVANSQGVREDIALITGLSPEAIHLIRNPVITPEFHVRAAEHIHHAWLTSPRDCPVILGAGGLRRQKDFASLIRAFATVRARRPCRLLILGEGQMRSELEELGRALSVGDDLDMPGFVPNPYPYMAAADVFVLSSRWEGSPNVLTEALALGTAVVATDCKSGPREILDHGRVAPLVPVGDAGALAEAIEHVLREPPDAAVLAAAAADQTMEANAAAYERLLETLVAVP